MSEKLISDYALIGDGETAALVARDATIEWLCFRRFDSEACFAALLGSEENGCWKMAPSEEIVSSSRCYRENTLILETTFQTKSGKARVIDFMPIRGEAPDIIRIVEGIEGEVEFTSELLPRFDYGRIYPLLRHVGDARSVAISGPNGMALDFEAEICFEDRRLSSRFTAREGERTRFILTWFASHLDELPGPLDADGGLENTEKFWTDWLQNVDYDGGHRESILRSLITLKALIHRPTGGIVAAPTASLPERSGGSRNWDYRYCWLRDATFSLLALINMGLMQEACEWIEWLRRAVGGQPVEMQPFFTIDGSRRAIEWQADWLRGFNDSQPVRFGNAAADQLQLDIYGEVIDALYQASRHGISANSDSDQLVHLLTGRLEEIWDQRDAGIWESRGEPKHHTYSKVMCWAAFDRASAWCRERGDDETADHYRELAAHVHDLVCEKGFHPDKNSFVRAFDDPALDAAVLRLPLVGFLPADDPRMIGTVAAIEKQLCKGGLVCRYAVEDTDDGVRGEEGAFVAACFWLAEVYCMQDRKDDAVELFERTLARSNDLDLLAEELAYDGDHQLGNFPQALSHLSLVAAAQRIFGEDGKGHERKRES